MNTPLQTRFLILTWCIGTVLLYTAATFAHAEKFLVHASGLAAFPIILLFLFAYSKTWLTRTCTALPDLTGKLARIAASALSKAIILIVICEFVIIGKLVLSIMYPVSAPQTENIPSRDTIAESIDSTKDWNRYSNKRHNFELWYPPYLEKSRSTGNETFIYCNGRAIAEGCDGVLYRLSITIFEEIFDTSRFDTYFDTPTRRYEIHRRDFYTGMQNIYSYSGWAAYTTINDVTVGIHFSGNGFIEGIDGTATAAELQKMMTILSTLQESYNL